MAGLALLLVPFARAGRDPARQPLAPRITPLGYYSVPLLQDPDRLWITGNITDRPFTLLLDTGCSVTMFDREIAGEIHPLPVVSHSLVDPLLGRLEGTNWCVIQLFTLARAKFMNMPAEVTDLRSGKSRQKGFEGILGADFSRRNHALILCGEYRLLMNGHSLAPSERLELEGILRGTGYTEVAMENMREVTWSVQVRAGASDLKLLVDTGAQFTILDDDTAKRLGVKVHGFGTKLAGVKNAETKGRHATVADFHLGSFRVPEVRLRVGNLSDWGVGEADEYNSHRERRSISVQGMLGFDFLKKHLAVIDCDAAKLWLRASLK